MLSLLQIGFYIIQNQLRCGTVCIFQLRCDHTMPFWKYAGDLQHKHAQVTEILQVSYRQDEVCVLLFQTITQTPVLIASLQSPKPLCNHSSTCLNIESIFFFFFLSLSYPVSFLCQPSVQTPPQKKTIFLTSCKAEPEHQGDPCVQFDLCGLSAVTKDHLETIYKS